MPWLILPSQLPFRFNIAPSQDVAVVANNGANTVEFYRWGLIPSWSKDEKIGYKMINARGESLAEKPSFRSAYKSRRCLILADGFYEWKKDPGGKSKTPYHIAMKSGEPFAFAGLWEKWRSPAGSEVKTCTIVTTEPNELVSNLHDRMPAILREADYRRWLNQEPCKPEELQPMLAPFPASEMKAYPVSTVVNIPANDTPDCVKPIA